MPGVEVNTGATGVRVCEPGGAVKAEQSNRLNPRLPGVLMLPGRVMSVAERNTNCELSRSFKVIRQRPA